MINFIKKMISNSIFSDELPTNARLFNLIFGVGLIASMLSVLMTMSRSTAPFAVVPEVCAMFTIGTTIIICNKKKAYEVGTLINFILFFIILFPLMFFVNGATRGGMPMYFLLSIVLTFLLMQGRKLVIFLIVDIMTIVGCILLSVYKPELVIHFESQRFELYDIVQSIIACGLLIGGVIRFQNKIYIREKEKAIAANKSKADFLAGVSHELRTPLNAIIGLGEIELRKELEDESRENLEKIYSSGRTLLNIINDLLDISKIESGNAELVPEEYELLSLLSDTVNQNAVRIGKKDIDFSVNASETLPRKLIGDELKVRQIINNLLSNAIKYTPEGKVDFYIDWEKEDEHAVLCFTVADTGLGIKTEDIKYLFSEYKRADIKKTYFIEGTGLGLPICKRLTDLMQGEITVESVYGEGSVFRATILQEIADKIPIGKSAVSNLADFKFINNVNIRSNKVQYTSLKGSRVLVVDDVETNLDVVKGLLKPYNIQVDCVNSGIKAIACLKNEEIKYDLVFMDHMMPEMDGMETVRMIREEIESEYAKTVPVIALTANAIVGNENMFLENGFQDFLSKPMDVTKLDVILKKWIGDQLEKVKESVETKDNRALIEFSKVNGFDMEAGLRIFNGSYEAYFSVLRSYIQHTPPLLDQLRNYSVTEDTLLEYAIAVHGIKGSSYNIHADKIAKMAGKLEKAAKNQDFDMIKSNTQQFISQVQNMVETLSFVVQNNEAGNVKKKKTKPDKKLLEKLCIASQNYDMEEMEQCISELEEYTYDNGNEMVQWLRTQMEEFEYEAIVEKLGAQIEGGASREGVF